MNFSTKILALLGAATLAISLSTRVAAQQLPESNGTAQQPAASSNGNGSESAAQTAMTFDLNACQNVGPGLFQCPASYKPICEPGYNRGDVTCLNVDENGVLIRQGMP